MKILTVSYKQKFPTGSYLNCDIGFEASIGENESPEATLVELKRLAEKFHRGDFPHLYTENGKPITYEQVEEEKPSDPHQALIDTIGYCTSVKFLEGLRPQVERANNYRVKEAFEEKLNQLFNK